MKKQLLFPAAFLWAAAVSAQAPDASRMRAVSAAAFPSWHLDQDARTGALRDAYGPSLPLPGATPVAKAEGLLRSRLTSLGVRPEEWRQTRDERDARASFVDYRQEIDGREVVFSHLRFRFGSNGELVRLKMAAYDAPAADMVPTKDPSSLNGAATSGLDADVRVSRVVVHPEWVWYPAPAGATQELHPAFPFEVEGTETSGLPAHYRGWVDATTGVLLFRANEVQEGLGATVKGIVRQQGITNFTDTAGLPYVNVQAGGITYVADSTGYVDASAVTLPATATVRLQGTYAKVNMGSGSGPTPSFTFPVTAQGQTLRLPDSSLQVNAYYHTTRMHDFMKRFLPQFTYLDGAMPVNVDLKSGTCNAFYSNGTLNFYATGGGCPSYADAASVIYHEYGHAIADNYYDQKGANRMFNGGLNEGYADVWAMCITRSPIIGPSTGTSIRRYDLTPKVFPSNIVGEVHGDGEIIAGAWWDVAVNIGNIDTMIQLFTESYRDLPDGPAGAEGLIFKSILVSALQADDNDNNLNNGTPHFAAIVNAFARHGIYYGSGATVTHTELAHQPAGQPIAVEATVSTASPALVGDVYLFYKLQDTVVRSYDSLRMLPQGNGVYAATLPAQPAASILNYYITLDNALASADRAVSPAGFRPNQPTNQVTLPYQFGVGISKRTVIDFETPLPATWVIGTASGDFLNSPGRWVQAKPQASYQPGLGKIGQQISQTGSDHTTGSGMCLVTGSGSSFGNANLDSGTTTVITPTFDLSGFTEPMVEYYRWFGNDRSEAFTGNSLARDDSWRAQLRDTNAALFWQNMDNTLQADYQWRRRLVRVSDFFKNEPTLGKSIQLRFIAQNNGNKGVVEAAVDDIVIYDKRDPASVNAVATQRASIHPNPANTQVTIALSTAAASGTVRISDAAGRTLSSTPLAAGQLEYVIPTAMLAPGLYFVTVQTEGMIQAHQLVVAH